MAKTKKSSSDFVCNICGLTLSRSSHLVRHRLVHSSTSSENFPCDKCNKSYSRKDVLLRHMRTAHLAAKTRRQSIKSTTPRKSVTCAHCLQPDLVCDGQSPCLACRKHQALCRTNAAQKAIAQPTSPETKPIETSERHLSTASSSSLPPDETANGFETEPSDVSIFSAREDHDLQKTGEDESLIDPRLRGDNISAAAAAPAGSVANISSVSAEPSAESPFDSSSQAHHDDWQHGVPPPYPFTASESTWSHGHHGYQPEYPYDRIYAPQPPGSDFEAMGNRETMW